MYIDELTLDTHSAEHRKNQIKILEVIVFYNKFHIIR